MSLNRVDLMGRLTADPDLRKTQSGIDVASFTLAVDRDYKSQDGQRETDFINCVAWRGTADFIDRNFAKGQMAVVTGSLQVRSFTDKEGKKRTATEVMVDNVYFAGQKQSNNSGYGKAGTPEYTEIDDDGELPF